MCVCVCVYISSVWTYIASSFCLFFRAREESGCEESPRRGYGMWVWRRACDVVYFRSQGQLRCHHRYRYLQCLFLTTTTTTTNVSDYDYCLIKFVVDKACCCCSIHDDRSLWYFVISWWWWWFCLFNYV